MSQVNVRTEPGDAGDLLLPKILHGPWIKVDRATRRTGRKLAEVLARDRPAQDVLELVRVAAGTVLHAGDCADSGDANLWHLRQISALLGYGSSSLLRGSAAASTLVDFFLAQRWGVLGLSIGVPQGLDTAPLFVKRVDAIATHFECFDKYVFRMEPDWGSFHYPEMTYSQLLAVSLLEEVGDWCDRSKPGPVMDQLRDARDRIRAASLSEVRHVLVESILRIQSKQDQSLASFWPVDMTKRDLESRVAKLPDDFVEARRKAGTSECITLVNKLYR